MNDQSKKETRAEIYDSARYANQSHDLHDQWAKRPYRLDHGHVEFASRLLHALEFLQYAAEEVVPAAGRRASVIWTADR